MMFDKLKAHFSPDRVSWRVGSTTQDKKRGLAFAYIDARDVMERLDDVCTPGGWQNKYSHANGKTICDIGIKINDEWVWKADGSGDTDVEAEKGAMSDAFKRAAVRWGIGRYLYEVNTPWVEIEPAGKSYRIKDSEMSKLVKALGGAPAPAPKTAANVAPADNAKLDSIAVANDMIAEMRKLATTRALETWIRNLEEKFKTLTIADAERVRNEYRGRHKAVKQAELVSA